MGYGIQLFLLSPLMSLLNGYQYTHGEKSHLNTIQKYLEASAGAECNGAGSYVSPRAAHVTPLEPFTAWECAV